MTKEDYMKLSKERLAELLVEKDREIFSLRNVENINFPSQTAFDPRPLCGFGGYCTNPHFDCVGCPGVYTPGIKTNITVGTNK